MPLISIINEILNFLLDLIAKGLLMNFQHTKKILVAAGYAASFFASSASWAVASFDALAEATLTLTSVTQNTNNGSVDASQFLTENSRTAEYLRIYVDDVFVDAFTGSSTLGNATASTDAVAETLSVNGLTQLLPDESVHQKAVATGVAIDGDSEAQAFASTTGLLTLDNATGNTTFFSFSFDYQTLLTTVVDDPALDMLGFADATVALSWSDSDGNLINEMFFSSGDTGVSTVDIDVAANSFVFVDLYVDAQGLANTVAVPEPNILLLLASGLLLIGRIHKKAIKV